MGDGYRISGPPYYCLFVVNTPLTCGDWVIVMARHGIYNTKNTPPLGAVGIFILSLQLCFPLLCVGSCPLDFYTLEGPVSQSGLIQAMCCKQPGLCPVNGTLAGTGAFHHQAFLHRMSLLHIILSLLSGSHLQLDFQGAIKSSCL